MRIDGKKHGKGIFTYLKKDKETVFKGKFLDDQPYSGSGKYRYIDSYCIHEGTWKDGKRVGFGRSFNSKDKLVYQGEWENDAPVLFKTLKKTAGIEGMKYEHVLEILKMNYLESQIFKINYAL